MLQNAAPSNTCAQGLDPVRLLRFGRKPLLERVSGGINQHQTYRKVDKLWTKCGQKGASLLRIAYPHCLPSPRIAYPSLRILTAHRVSLPHTAYHHRVPALLTAYPYPSLRIPTVHPHRASLRRTAHCSLCIHTVHCSLRILIAYCVSLQRTLITYRLPVSVPLIVHCPLRIVYPYCLPLLLTIKTPGTLLTAYPYHISLT